jgi:hypothetical protein
MNRRRFGARPPYMRLNGDGPRRVFPEIAPRRPTPQRLAPGGIWIGRPVRRRIPQPDSISAETLGFSEFPTLIWDADADVGS